MTDEIISKYDFVSPEVTITNAVVHKDGTSVEILVDTHDGAKFYTGFSQLQAPDIFDPQRGFDLAFWRAMDNVVKNQLRRIEGFIKHEDDVRAAKTVANNLKFNDSVVVRTEHGDYYHNIDGHDVECEGCKEVLEAEPDLFETGTVIWRNGDFV